jgi:hypothetical protein
MRAWLAAALAVVVAACTSGQNFTRPSPESLALGSVGRADILASYGKPERELTRVIAAPAGFSGGSSEIPSSGLLTSLFYTYRDRTLTAWTGRDPLQKLIRFDFANDRLFAYRFLSTFEEDSSDFDDARVAQLVNGATTKQEAVALLGAPTGRSIFPAVLPGDEKYVYQHVENRGGDRHVKSLELIFGDDDRLRDFSYLSDVGPAPRPTPASVPLPIFIPSK